MINKEISIVMISGIFAIIVACITGAFLLANTWLEKSIIVVPTSMPRPEIAVSIPTPTIVVVPTSTPWPENTISMPISTSVIIPSPNSLCPMIVIEGTTGGLRITQTKTWSELSATTQEPQSVNLSEVCSRNSDNQVQVWVGYWNEDPGYLNFSGTMTPDEAISLVRQNPNQPVLIVPWGK